MTNDLSPLRSGAFAGALCDALGRSTAVAVLVLDEALQVREANPAARTTLRLGAADHVGSSLDDLVEPADVARLREAMRVGGDLPGPFLLRAAGAVSTPDSALLVSVTRPSVNGGAPGLVLLGRSAGPEVRREARVLRARRLQIVGQLTGGIAHELNNRLSTVTTFSDLLLGDVEPGSQEAEDLAEIKQAGLDSAVITRKLDLFSGGHAGGASESFLDQVVGGLEKLLRRFVSPDVALEASVDPECPPVAAAPIRIEEILVALVANARDAMPEGGRVTIRARPGGRTDRHPGGCAVLEVVDTGDARDVPPLSRAVEPFFSCRPPDRASGLGLATVQGIVGELGGDLDMSCEPGTGTTVTVTLPAAAEDEDDLDGAKHAAPGEVDAVQRQGRIALVEPDDGLRRALGRCLASAGFGVEAAATVGGLGSDGRPAAALSDVPDRPGAGADLVRALRARWEAIPVVLMRRRTTPREFPEAEPGVREVAKPIDPAAIRAALVDAVRASALDDPHRPPAR